MHVCKRSLRFPKVNQFFAYSDRFLSHVRTRESGSVRRPKSPQDSRSPAPLSSRTAFTSSAAASPSSATWYRGSNRGVPSIKEKKRVRPYFYHSSPAVQKNASFSFIPEKTLAILGCDLQLPSERAHLPLEGFLLGLRVHDDLAIMAFEPRRRSSRFAGVLAAFEGPLRGVDERPKIERLHWRPHYLRCL